MKKAYSLFARPVSDSEFGGDAVSYNRCRFATRLEYICNPAFHFKLLFMALAGLNELTFYVTVSRRTLTLGAGQDAPRPAKIIAAHRSSSGWPSSSAAGC